MKCHAHWLAIAALCLATAIPSYAIDAGKPAPAFTAKSLAAKSINLAVLAGKVVVINFWATWCSPCRQEMPALDAFYRQHQAEGLEVIGVSVDDNADLPLVKTLAQAVSYPIAMSDDASFSGYGRIWRVPLTFVIDRKGIVRTNGWQGDTLIDAATLESTVLPLLK
ncbi:TlpA family protein disulfide reductase [Andreprevotia chitinilytica]|uniref:TlpA family protein disulfide reductase n=1 Tax=Andreprevotia chitinilytica TaxID=396808 RepID=UPI00068B114B|nr:TlpA disulfide reductase family protein [Andreprevotia chitinilytica]